MWKPMLLAPILIPLLASLAEAQQCDASAHCGATVPCCSEYGYCGKDAYCLAGCNPLYSYAWDSCAPDPICRSGSYDLKNTSRIVNVTQYNGDATAYDFTIDHGQYQKLQSSDPSNGGLALLLTESNGGTRLSTTRYMLYGSATARLKTSKWQGVVTAFISMSDVKDEIDCEFPGANTTQAQSNYFWLGEVNYPLTNGKTSPVSNDSYSNWHDYTINWQPDQLDFSIDGVLVRSVLRNETFDSQGRPEYPSTPARIQLSIWPAGINSSSAGTIQWAGGLINWNDPDYTAAGGHFSAVFDTLTIQCNDTTNNSISVDSKSYVYSGNNSFGIPSAYISNATSTISISPGSGPTSKPKSGSGANVRVLKQTLLGSMVAVSSLLMLI